MNDLKGYIEKLDKSMTKKEKLFFLNKVKLNKYDYIVDFGCANGRLLYEVDKHLNGKAKDLQLFGVEKNTEIAVDYDFTHQFKRVEKIEDLPLGEMVGKKVLLLLSSVLHELESISELIAFSKIFVTTIVIRDMHIGSTRKISEKEKKYADEFIHKQLDKLSNEECKMFEYISKRIDNNSDNAVKEEYRNIQKLYEFFLKYTYTENWETEKLEDYFNNTAHFIFMCGILGFKPTYNKHYILPYKKKEVYKHFGYKMRSNTHIKLILENNNSRNKQTSKIDPLWYLLGISIGGLIVSIIRLIIYFI